MVKLAYFSEVIVSHLHATLLPHLSLTVNECHILHNYIVALPPGTSPNFSVAVATSYRWLLRRNGRSNLLQPPGICCRPSVSMTICTVCLSTLLLLPKRNFAKNLLLWSRRTLTHPTHTHTFSVAQGSSTYISALPFHRHFFDIHLFHTHTHSHLFLMTHLSHTTHPLTALERKTLSLPHDSTCSTFARNFFTRTFVNFCATLSHIALSRTTLYNYRSSTISFVFPAFPVQLQPLFVVIGRS